MTPTPEAAQNPFSTSPIDHAELTRALHSAYRGIRAEPSFMQTLAFSIEQFIRNLFSTLYRTLVDASGPGKVLIWLFLAAGGLVLVWTIVWLLRRVGLVGERSLNGLSRELDRVDWQAEADKALSGGDLTGATRALYRQLVITLIKKGWLPDSPGVTSGDCRRAVRELPDLYRAVEAATRAFERTTYGRSPVHGPDIEILRFAGRLAMEAPTRVGREP
ncbi:MAG TPA: DUF4129 domain-containing protein [Actinomycetota bacterium]|nr:DUF4129 domain-containing protein [Actinomycetota bacterium]